MHATTRELIAIRDGDPVAACTLDHVADCLTCRQDLEGVRRLQSQLQTLPELDAPASTWANIDRRLATKQSAGKEHRKMAAFPLAMAAGLAGMLALGVWLSGNEIPVPATHEPSQSDTTRLDSLALQEQAVELEGLRLFLDADSQPMSLATLDTIDALDHRIHSIGLQLNEINNPEQRLALWQEKVHLLEAALTLETTESETFRFADVASL